MPLRVLDPSLKLTYSFCNRRISPQVRRTLTWAERLSPWIFGGLKLELLDVMLLIEVPSECPVFLFLQFLS